MGQSRPRRYPELKSNLNYLREGVLLLFSSLLWFFTFMAFITVTFTFLGINSYYVQLVRTILNITRGEILNIILVIGISSIIFFFYLLISYSTGPFKKKKDRREVESEGIK